MIDTMTSNDQVQVEIHRKIFSELIEKIISNEKYQKKLFLIYSIATFISCLAFTMLPSQKNLPEFICLDINTENDLLEPFDFFPFLNLEELHYSQKEKIYEKYANLFYPKINNFQKLKIVKNKECINKYCSNFNIKKLENNKIKILNNSEKIIYTKILVNYDSLKNYVTNYDSFCDYDEFFGFLTTMFIFWKIIGSLFFSYISDKYGRLISFKIMIYIYHNFK